MKKASLQETMHQPSGNAGTGVVFSETREGLRVHRCVAGGAATRSTRPPRQGDLLLQVQMTLLPFTCSCKFCVKITCIFQIDGQDVHQLGLSKVRGLLLGQAGTTVILRFLGSDTSAPYDTAIKREPALSTNSINNSVQHSPHKTSTRFTLQVLPNFAYAVKATLLLQTANCHCAAI
jgi:hypothetical protein